MQAWARTGSALFLGALCALMLMLTMQSLVVIDDAPGEAPQKLRFVDFLPRSDPAPDRPQEKLQDPELAPPAPPVPQPQLKLAPPSFTSDPLAPQALQIPAPSLQAPPMQQFDVPVAAPVPPASPAAPVPVGTTADRDVTPLVRIEPIYPRTAQRRGIEGYVVVEFTVTTEGATRDVRVIESTPPGIFDRAAVSAAQQFRFQPRIRSGQPVEASGVRNRITFRLE